ncbi:MAG TPA: dipeptidase [bacterium]|nr:dipeptidase [bacterium]HNE85042.1 dipeptidase [bacterium]HNF86867.1 dipeptidase [bacterium]HNH28791.1 dipeptidase [bacterium]HNH31712.1 dipeptidase [bacterium]
MEKVISHIESNKDRYVEELKDFLKIPSISTNPENKKDVQHCAEWVAQHMTHIGLNNVKVCPTAGHPVVYGEWLGAPGKPTVLLYGHYDVQPVDPLNLWTSGPFEPTIRDGYIYARGSADDKGQVFLNLKSIEAHLKINGSLPVNVKLMIEGEEEIGSEHLEPFMKENKEMLKADVVLISDTSMFDDGIPSIAYGLRGLCYMQVELTGPNRDLHSGTYGGAVGNPINELANMIAKLKDKNGKITIPGFYDKVKPLTKAQRDAYKKLPFNKKGYLKDLGIKETFGEKGYSILEQVSGRPTLDCNGIWGGFQGEGAKTVLPSKAGAKISMRLVPGQKPAEIAKLFEKYIKKIAPKTMQVKVIALHGGDPAMTDITTKEMTAASTAMQKVFKKKPLFTREGGSIPVVAGFERLLGLKTIMLGFGLDTDAIHSPNERFKLDNFHKGILTTAYFYDEMAKMK